MGLVVTKMKTKIFRINLFFCVLYIFCNFEIGLILKFAIYSPKKIKKDKIMQDWSRVRRNTKGSNLKYIPISNLKSFPSTAEIEKSPQKKGKKKAKGGSVTFATQ